MPAREGRAPGHFGELLQGRLGPDGPLALVTLPCPVLEARAWLAPGPRRVTQRPAVLDPAGLRALARALGLPARLQLLLRLDMPPGGGAGASTAARVAVARAAGLHHPQQLAALCLALEGAIDPLMFAAPERLLWASRAGRVLARLPALPRLEVLGGFFGPGQRTDPRDLHFPDIAALVAAWPGACGDPAALARLVSASAQATLALRGPADDPTAALAARNGALGWAIAHTGAARALLFRPGTIPAAAIRDLRAAGFLRITRFLIGGT